MSTEPTQGPVTCNWCGTSADTLPLTWTRSVEQTGATTTTRLLCDRCSREHLRSIESKLDSTWW
jgi:hypothetical protein